MSWRRRFLLLRRVAPTPTRTRVVWVRLLSRFTFRPAPSCASGVRPESPRLQVFVEVAVVSVEFSTHYDAFGGVVALPLAVVRAVGVRLVTLPIPPITSIPPTPVALTHAGCGQGMPCLLSPFS